MKYISLLILISTYLLAETVHSSVSTYYENLTFKNSKQKEDAFVYGIGADVHYSGSKYKVAFEHSKANTKQPPLKKDLVTDKLFMRYAYEFSDAFEVNLNYINILNDNIAITDEGKAYGLGVSYHLNKKVTFNFTQFYSSYEDFSVNQSDFNLDFKAKISGIKIKLSSLTKYISLDEENKNSFTKNAQKDYLASALKLHAHYNTYHLGLGAYMGKRVFAIMQDGFKIQHHAMEFDRTYAIGAGKNISNFVVRLQYVYQRAIEIPTKNKDVKVSNVRILINYKI